MAKRPKKEAESASVDDDANVESHRVTTHPTNGSPPESMEVAPATVTAAEAMRRAVAELGDVVIDEQLAAQQLRSIAESYEHLVAEEAAFHQKSEAAKVAKKSVEAAQALLNTKIQEYTHPKPLPLFDQAAREADVQAMIDAANPAIAAGGQEAS